MELFVSKAGAKVQTFFELAKKIFQKIFIALKISIMSLKKREAEIENVDFRILFFVFLSLSRYSMSMVLRSGLKLKVMPP